MTSFGKNKRVHRVRVSSLSISAADECATGSEHNKGVRNEWHLNFCKPLRDQVIWTQMASLAKQAVWKQCTRWQGGQDTSFVSRPPVCAAHAQKARASQRCEFFRRVRP